MFVIAVCGTSSAFEIPNLGNFFKLPTNQPSFKVAEKKAQLLQAVSFTGNGKDATPEQQERVLAMVAELEEKCPVSENLLSNPIEIRNLDGTWFLQYTSASKIGDGDEFPVSNGDYDFQVIIKDSMPTSLTRPSECLEAKLCLGR